MRLLVVSYLYAPQISPRAFRWAALAEHWAAAGHDIDVVAGHVPGAPREETRNGVRVQRTGGGLVELLRGRFRAATDRQEVVREQPSPGEPPRRGAGGGGAASLARRVHDRTWKRLYWPDAACLWYPSARRAAERLASARPPEALVTVSHPFTGHLVGLALRRRHPRLPWLVDIGDPFAFLEQTPPNNLALWRARNFRAEGRVLAAADVVAVTNERTLERYAAGFPGTAAKLVSIPPLLSTRAAGSASAAAVPFFPPSSAAARPIRLVFVGTLYRGIRSPAPLLDLLEALAGSPVGTRIELHFVGSVHDSRDVFERAASLLGRSVFLHGLVSREAAAAAMREANVLVNLGNETAYQLPSKVVEYASSGKPVLNLVRDAGDATLPFFAGFGRVLHVIAPDRDALRAQAGTIARFLEAPPPASPGDAAFSDRFRIEAVARDYERALDRARERAGAGEGS